MNTEQQKETWEPELIREMLLFSLKEQRSRRRWQLLGRIGKVFLVIGFIGLAYFAGKGGQTGWGQGDTNKDHIAYIDIYGPIGAGQLADADRLLPALDKAFNNNKVKAVVMRINSPGGSPVQSSRVYQGINDLKDQFPDKKVYAVIEDIGASGAYFIAAAADKIFADRSSMVGSIGVISASFGFNSLLDEIGVERRVFKSGDHKALMDPYSPMNSGEKEYWEGVLKEVHGHFIDAVKQGRGDVLEDNPKLFSGLVWTGEKAMTLGLIDGLGSLQSVSRDTIGESNLINYTPSPDFIKQLARNTRAEISSFMQQTFRPSLF